MVYLLLYKNGYFGYFNIYINYDYYVHYKYYKYIYCKIENFINFI